MIDAGQPFSAIEQWVAQFIAVGEPGNGLRVVGSRFRVPGRFLSDMNRYMKIWVEYI